MRKINWGNERETRGRLGGAYITVPVLLRRTWMPKGLLCTVTSYSRVLAELSGAGGRLSGTGTS